MKVVVKYMAQVRLAAQTAAEEVDLAEASSVSHLLARLAQRHGEPMKRLLFDADGRPRNTLLMFNDDEQIIPGKENFLQDGAVVTLLTPIAGG